MFVGLHSNQTYSKQADGTCGIEVNQQSSLNLPEDKLGSCPVRRMSNLTLEPPLCMRLMASE